MSQFEVVKIDIARVINSLMDDARTAIIHPSFVANAVIAFWQNGDSLDDRIRWTSIEQIKQMARQMLRNKADTDSENSVAYQGDLFTGILQPFYPMPGGKDGYKRLELLSDSELAWNVKALRKQATARLEHADALEAYRLRQAAA